MLPFKRIGHTLTVHRRIGTVHKLISSSHGSDKWQVAPNHRMEAEHPTTITDYHFPRHLFG